VLSVTRGHGRPEMTPSFDSATSVLYKWSVGVFCLSLSFQKVIHHCRFCLKLPLGLKVWRFGDFRPLNVSARQRDPEKAPPCMEPRCLSHHACLCDAPFGLYAIERKKPLSCYISRMHGGALIQAIAMKVCTFFKVTNAINRANFGGCMLRGLVTAKDRIQAFPVGS
jgi:hypothetical protein